MVLAIVVGAASPALAGPPLICFPFQTEGGRMLPWLAGTNWNAQDPAYDIRTLVADTVSLLAPEGPLLTRMENMRRATIYAMRDPKLAHQLLRAVMDRALDTTTDGGAWFDAGYLIESFKQAAAIRELGNPEWRAWAAVDEMLRVDGYNWVKKAISMSGPSAELEFAASLMTEGSVASAHRSRAMAGAPRGGLLAKNLASRGY